jgi:mannose-1-phosphate guanylyltransferase/mannose-6-phosphate isomerase
VTHNVTNTYLHSETRVIGAIGLNELMVIDTPGCTAGGAPQTRCRTSRSLVNQLKARGIRGGHATP